jgi:hypothetical protein
MPRTLKWIGAAILIVLTILIAARSLNGQSIFPDYLEANFFAAEVGPDTLTLTDGEDLPLHIGSSVEVHRFTLNAGFPYSLRYLTFEVDMQDLSVENVNDWAVYEIHNDEIAYQSKVAQGESFDQGLLKLRFYSDRSYAYLGEGKQEFALVTNLERSGENASLQLKQANPDGFYHWAWQEGHLDEAWGSF